MHPKFSRAALVLACVAQSWAVATPPPPSASAPGPPAPTPPTPPSGAPSPPSPPSVSPPTPPSPTASLPSAPSPSAVQEYDFIVVGGGTAGAVIANRLSENPQTSVLLLEAGVSNQGVLDSEVPLLAFGMANTIYDWNYTTVPQRGLNNNTIAYTRGKLLGGSSSVNYMVYTRGSSDDWDRYARITGDSGWSWAGIQQFIHKSEDFLPLQGVKSIGTFNSSAHSISGLVQDSTPYFNWPLDDPVIQTTQDLPHQFPQVIDMNAGDPVGFGWAQQTIGNGSRSSSATSYLSSQFTKRPNLSIMLNAQVTKLLTNGTLHGVPSFNAVQFASSANAAVHTVKARNEIIISAGTLNTPQLLMLSGIGDKSALAKVGIPSVVHSSSVGQNFSDHAIIPNIWFTSLNQTYDVFLDNEANFTAAMTQWNATRRGPMSALANQLGWARLPANDSAIKQLGDPSAGPKSPHLEILIGCGLGGAPGGATPAPGNFIQMSTAVVSPTSRGSVQLNTSDPFHAPLIDPNFLDSDFDAHAIVQAIKLARSFVAAPAFDGVIGDEFGPFANATTDDEILAYARSMAGTLFHGAGTAAMSAKGASWGVVDPDLKVKGAVGLRVVDASILPIVPAAHIQAAVYIVAERAADLIKSDYDSGY